MNIAEEQINFEGSGMTDKRLTELYDDLSKVIWVPCPNEKPNITDPSLVLRLTPEDVFLHIGNTLQEEPDHKQNHSGDIPSGAKPWLIESRYIRRVENGHR